MYLDYWHLAAKPFDASPDVQFFWPSPNHEEAFQRLLLSCHEQMGFMVLTGEYGCGKTLLSRALILELQRDAHSQIALIFNPRLGTREFLKMVLFELGGSKDRQDLDKVQLLSQIQELLEGSAKAGRHTTLLIDEAQAIPDDEILEEIRLLTNI